jgi:hypothetical protein
MNYMLKLKNDLIFDLKVTLDLECGNSGFQATHRLTVVKTYAKLTRHKIHLHL